MNNQQKVLKMSEVKFQNIVYDEAIYSSNKEFIVFKMWYKNDKVLQTLNVQMPNAKIFKFVENNNSIILIPNIETEKFMQDLDKLSYKFANDNKIVKKFNLENFTYKSLISELETPQMNVLLMKILTEKRPTLFFSSKNKNIVEYENAKKFFSKIDSLKIIFEIDGLIIDMKKKELQQILL